MLVQVHVQVSVPVPSIVRVRVRMRVTVTVTVTLTVHIDSVIYIDINFEIETDLKNKPPALLALHFMSWSAKCLTSVEVVILLSIDSLLPTDICRMFLSSAGIMGFTLFMSSLFY